MYYTLSGIGVLCAVLITGAAEGSRNSVRRRGKKHRLVVEVESRFLRRRGKNYDAST